jgi:hypothetical protein
MESGAHFGKVAIAIAANQKWRHLVTCNSCWFQQLLPPPLSFKFPLFASSKNGRRLALARAERDLQPSWGCRLTES